MSAWDKLPVKSGGGGLWDHLARDMENPATLENGLGIWAASVTRPSGLWRDVQDGTLLVPRDSATRQDVWQIVNQETLLLDRAAFVNLWRASEDALKARALGQAEDSGIWGIVRDETLLVDRSETPIWSRAQRRNRAQITPTRAEGWAVKKLTSAQGEEYYVLKNLRTDVYLRLDEKQLYLWNLMDGEHSVQDLAVACFMRYQTLSMDWLEGYLGQLESKGFLTSEKVDVYRRASGQLWQRTVGYWSKRIFGFLLRSQIWIKGIDPVFGWIYRLGGRLIFTWPIQILMLLVSVAGLASFFYVSRQGDLSLLTGPAGGALSIGLVGLLLAQILAVIVHESAHALTTKHYGRHVRRGGVGLYFGMLTFFVDTTDIWMEPRRPRLAVTWAGPYSGLVLGGVASLLLVFTPVTTWSGIAYQFATFCYAIVLANLNPLLKLDGYYLLMDWLEIPRLRERSINFMRRKFLPKLRQRQAFNREERIFAVFGILALIWTGTTLISLVWLYGGGLIGALGRLLNSVFSWA